MKKTMKTRARLIALTGILAMSLLAGCGTSTKQAASTSQAPTTSQTQPAPATSAGAQSN